MGNKDHRTFCKGKEAGPGLPLYSGAWSCRCKIVIRLGNLAMYVTPRHDYKVANKEYAALPYCIKCRWNIACNLTHNVCCKLSQQSICMFLLVKVLFIHLSEACFDFIKCKFQSHKPCWNYRHETTNGKYELLCALCLHSSFAISVTTYCSKLVLKRSFPGTDVWDFASKSTVSAGLIICTTQTT